MKCLVVFAFVLTFSGVAGEKVDLNQCLTVALTVSGVNPGGACNYVEDAVRCGINNLGLLKDNTTEQSARTLTNGYLRHYNCSVTFDDIFNATKAKPELLELQRCIDTAMLQNLQDPDFFKTCPPLEQSITCGIGAIKVYEEDASDDVVKSFRSFANDELKAINCDVTFDDILNEIKANPETLKQRGCNYTAVEGSQGCDHAKNNTLCGIKIYQLNEDAPPNDYLMVMRATYDWDFGNQRCNITFDDILNEVKAKPELLDDQSCPDTPYRDGVTICDRIGEGVRCGIRALELYKDKTSNGDLMYGRQLASRYMTPFRCSKTFTFDDLLKEEEDEAEKEEEKGKNCSTVSPMGWLTAVMVALMVMFTDV